jgi:hypothetical protein
MFCRDLQAIISGSMGMWVGFVGNLRPMAYRRRAVFDFCHGTKFDI